MAWMPRGAAARELSRGRRHPLRARSTSLLVACWRFWRPVPCHPRTTTHSKVLRCIEARQAVQAMGWVTVSEVGMRLG